MIRKNTPLIDHAERWRYIPDALVVSAINTKILFGNRVVAHTSEEAAIVLVRNLNKYRLKIKKLTGR